MLLDLAQTVKARLELEVVVRRSLSNSRDDGDIVTLGANIVSRGDTSDVDVWYG